MTSSAVITELISAAEARESNVIAVLDMLSPLTPQERAHVLAAALLKTTRLVGPIQILQSPSAEAAFADEPVASPAPSLPDPPNPPKARPTTTRKGSGREATRLLSDSDVARMLDLVAKHPGSSSPWLAKQLGVNQAGQRWRNTLQTALETGLLRREGKDNKTKYFRGPMMKGPSDAGP